MSKKKLIITITSLCLVVVAAVAAVVAVLAAANQTVQSNISVSYSANNVKATAYLDYKYQNSNTWMAPSQTADQDLPADVATTGFSVTEAQTTKTLSSRALALGGKNSGQDYVFDRYVIYRFTFHNDYTAQTSRYVKVTLTYGNNTANENNVIIGWSKIDGSTDNRSAVTDPTLDITGWTENQTTFADANDPANYTTTVPYSTTGNELYLAPNQYGYVYMAIAIKDVTNDASFSAGNGVISFALESTTNPNA